MIMWSEVFIMMRWTHMAVPRKYLRKKQPDLLLESRRKENMMAFSISYEKLAGQ